MLHIVAAPKKAAPVSQKELQNPIYWYALIVEELLAVELLLARIVGVRFQSFLKISQIKRYVAYPPISVCKNAQP